MMQSRFFWLLAAAALVLATAAAKAPPGSQEVEVTAPGLTAYDEIGRPEWDVRVEKLWQTTAGWQGEGAKVYLFHEGEEEFRLLAQRIQANETGRTWILSDGVTGEGHELSFTCSVARFEEKLILSDVLVHGEGLELRAEEGSFRPGEAIEFVAAKALVRNFTISFASGRYDPTEKILTAHSVELVGHGIEVLGEEISAWPEEGRIVVLGAKLVPRA